MSLHFVVLPKDPNGVPYRGLDFPRGRVMQFQMALPTAPRRNRASRIQVESLLFSSEKMDGKINSWIWNNKKTWRDRKLAKIVMYCDVQANPSRFIAQIIFQTEVAHGKFAHDHMDMVQGWVALNLDGQ